MLPLFKDRSDAGRHLGLLLADHYSKRHDVLVLGLARGGVPVAYEVAGVLGAPLDVLLVRKLGLPQHKEYAMGAIASGGVTVLNDDVLRTMGVSQYALEVVMAKEQKELCRREASYRADRSVREVNGHTVILVDDGLATGATMRAAIASVKRQHARAVVVAVPVAASDSFRQIQSEVDDIVSLATPEIFRAVGWWYQYFPQVSDNEVCACLSGRKA